MFYFYAATKYAGLFNSPSLRVFNEKYIVLIVVDVRIQPMLICLLLNFQENHVSSGEQIINERYFKNCQILLRQVSTVRNTRMLMTGPGNFFRRDHFKLAEGFMMHNRGVVQGGYQSRRRFRQGNFIYSIFSISLFVCVNSHS